MVLSALLALAGYATAPLLGAGIYLTLFRRGRWVEGIAFAWGVGGVTTNLLVMVVHQVLGVPLARGWVLGGTAAMGTVAALLLWRRRDALRGVGGLLRDGARGWLRPRTLLLAGPLLLFPLLIAKAVAYPETGPDSVFYHLFLAKEAFVTGSLPRTGGLGWLELANSYPNLFVTQQIWVYFAAGSAAQLLARPLVPVYAVLLGALTVTLGNRLRPGAGPLALLLLTAYTIPATVLLQFLTPSFVPFGRLSVEIWTDVPVAFYALLAVHFVLRGLREGGRLPWVVGGLFGGGAALTKYNGLVFAAVLVAVLLGALVLERVRNAAGEGRVRPRSVLAFLIPLAGLTGLLFLRNQLLFGNPVYPFYTDLFGGVNLRSAALIADFVPGNIGALKREQAYVLLTSLPFLLFLPSLRLGTAALRLLQVTAGVFVAYLLVGWSFQSAFYRMILPALPLVALSAGAWLHRALLSPRGLGAPAVAVGGSVLALALRPGLSLAVAAIAIGLLAVLHAPHLRRVLRRPGARVGGQAAVLLVLSLSLANPAIQAVAAAKYPSPTLGPLPVGLPRVPDTVVLERAYGGDWDVWMWMNENLPEGARIMTLHPGRYYTEATFVCPASTVLVAHYDADLAGALAILEAANVSYVLDSVFTHGYVLTEPFWRQSPVFQNLPDESRFELLYENPDHRLYRLRP